ncbi:MAG: hypothetical protein KC766_06220 [Myxococcales bacterium]|nr:hypothetical protein [Myxococcales bacterium]
MTPLFVSFVCDFCDGLASDASCDRGFVVWRNRPTPAEEYVFRTRKDAERWRVARSLEECSVLEVRSPYPFRWRTSSGTVRDIQMADSLVSIWPDHRFASAPNHAFLVDAAA